MYYFHLKLVTFKYIHLLVLRTLLEPLSDIYFKEQPTIKCIHTKFTSSIIYHSMLKASQQYLLTSFPGPYYFTTSTEGIEATTLKFMETE